MKSYSALIPFAIFTLFEILNTADVNLIDSTCKILAHSDPNINYSFCTTSLQAAPGSQCATLQRLGTISIRLILYNVTNSSCYIKQQMKNGKWDPYVMQCFRDCSDLFSDAIDSVKQAMSYYDARRFDDANVQISSVMEAATTCEDGFKERGGITLPMTKRNNDTFQLSAIALSVMHMIQTGSG